MKILTKLSIILFVILMGTTIGTISLTQTLVQDL